LAHEQTCLSNDTIDSVLQHREVGRVKDLSAPPRNEAKLYGEQINVAFYLLNTTKFKSTFLWYFEIF